MSVVRRVPVEQRQARLALRHRLAPSARLDDDPVAITRSTVVLHASDPSTVVLSALARMASPDPAVVAHALYDDRTLVRLLAMRRTLFVAATEDVVVVQRSSGDAVARTERRRLSTLLEGAGITTDATRWLRRVETKTLAALDALGSSAAAELSTHVSELAIQIPVHHGKAYAGRIGVGSRVLLLLAAEGLVVRTSPKGTWTSSLHRWATVDTWLGGPLAPMPADEARAALARLWLERFGPATVADLKWWTGWSLGHTRAALAAIATEPVDLDGVDGIVLAGDAEPVASPEPWVALLPSLDPTAMGWTHRAWYLGEHKPAVFDGYGNAGATVWVDGRIVGGWAQRRSGEVVTRVLEDVGADRVHQVDAAAAGLQQVLGDIRIAPRFPAPLDRALVT